MRSNIARFRSSRGSVSANQSKPVQTYVHMLFFFYLIYSRCGVQLAFGAAWQRSGRNSRRHRDGCGSAGCRLYSHAHNPGANRVPRPEPLRYQRSALWLYVVLYIRDARDPQVCENSSLWGGLRSGWHTLGFSPTVTWMLVFNRLNRKKQKWIVFFLWSLCKVWS